MGDDSLGLAGFGFRPVGSNSQSKSISLKVYNVQVYSHHKFPCENSLSKIRIRNFHVKIAYLKFHFTKSAMILSYWIFAFEISKQKFSIENSVSKWYFRVENSYWKFPHEKIPYWKLTWDLEISMRKFLFQVLIPIT